jgi:hypothetical protein
MPSGHPENYTSLTDVTEKFEIRVAEFTTSDIGDAPMLPELLAQISTVQDIVSVTADGNYETRKCNDAHADRGAVAIIPPHKNAKPWKADTRGAATSNEALRASKYLSRVLWQPSSVCHSRSRVETKMHCVKLLCQRLMPGDFNR